MGLGAKHLPHARAAALLDPLKKHIMPQQRGSAADVGAADKGRAGGGRVPRPGAEASARDDGHDDDDDESEGDEKERRGGGRGARAAKKLTGFDVKQALRSTRDAFGATNMKNRRKKEKRRAKKLAESAARDM